VGSESSVPVIVAAVGAGRMGRGIAITFALAGHSVRLIDVKERTAADYDELVKTASSEIDSTLAMLARIGLFIGDEIPAITARITYCARESCDSALKDAGLVFEAVPETMEAKEAAFRLITRHSDTSAIVASTTSTILSDDLQPFVENPERFLNAHWLNPAFLVPLVEVSPGRDTDPSVTDRLVTLLEAIGKVPVVCSASPGYIVPRIQALAMNEAARMVEEGVASVDDIDKATKYGFGFRFAILGLLEFIDWGGGDILFYASRYMTSAMGSERYASPAIVERNMEEGRIGLRTRQGFLDYSSMDISDYQQQKLSEFVGMLRHIDKLPPTATSKDPGSGAIEPECSDAVASVRQYLTAMENRDLELATGFLAEGFTMTFPGGVSFNTLQQLVDWSKTRYQSIGKTYEQFDQSTSDGQTIVYCYGTLHGTWLDGSPFSGIRFIDRFVVRNGLLYSQLVWNDLSENLANTTAT